MQEITETGLVHLSYALRYRIWSKEVQLAENFQKEGLIHDEHDSHARHWGVLSDAGNLVASARMCLHQDPHNIPEADFYSQLEVPSPVASINRLVVDQCARGRKLGRFLDSHRIEAARMMGAACIVAAPTDDYRVRALRVAGFSLTSCKCKSIYVDNLWLPVMVLHL